MSTYVETHMTSTMIAPPTEDITTTLLPLTSIENMMTISLESNVTEDQESINITEQSNTMISSTPVDWSSYNSDNNTLAYTTDMIQNSTEQINNTTESTEFIMNMTSQTIIHTSSESRNYLSIQTDDNLFNTLEQTMTSTMIIT